MAGFSIGVTTTSTTDASSFTTAGFTPIRNALLVVFAIASDCVIPRPVITQSLTGLSAISFTQIGPAVTFGPSIHSLYCFVANSLVPVTTSRTVTVNTSPTTATASIINVNNVMGLYKAGPAAIRQFATNADGAGGVAPTAVFPAPVLTTNSYVAAMANLTNPNLSAGPLGSALQRVTLAGTGIDTPTLGLGAYSGAQGLTLTTFTWGASSATAWGAFALEFDTTDFTAQDRPPLVAGWGGTR